MNFIEYHIPNIGKVSAVLFPLAERCYKFLNKNGHIDKMKRMDQLGVIRNVYEGAHHTRWEYVTLQLSLIYQLATQKDWEKNKKIASDLGLSSNISILSENCTGADMLQTWVLLLNAGHLPGTFASERALLCMLKENSKFLKRFRSGLPDKKTKDFLGELIQKENSYRMHILICFFLLQRYRKQDPELTDSLMEVLRYYCLGNYGGNSVAINKRLELFRRIRQISYLYLDAQYGPVPLNLQLGSILINMSDFVDELFRHPNSALSRTLNSFENFLSENIYLTAQSMLAHKIQKDTVLSILKKNSDNVPTIKKIQQLLTNEEKIKIYTENTKEYDEIRFKIDLSPFEKQIKPIEIEERWEAKIGKSICLVGVNAAPYGKSLYITLAFKLNELKNKQLGRVLSKSVLLLDSLRNNLTPEKFFDENTKFFIINRVFRYIFIDLIVFILQALSKNKNVAFEPNRKDQIFFNPNLIRGAKTAHEYIKVIIDNTEGLDRARKHECETLSVALKEILHKGLFLYILSQTMIYNKDRSILGELDGLALLITNNSLKILIVEAKDQNRGSVSRARRQLQRTLERIIIKNFTPSCIEELPNYGAYALVSI